MTYFNKSKSRRRLWMDKLKKLRISKFKKVFTFQH